MWNRLLEGEMMSFFTIFTFVLILLSKSNQLETKMKCGPLNQCVCVKISDLEGVSMDCSVIDVTLQGICNFTRTNSNISELAYNSNNLTMLKKDDLIGCKDLIKMFLRNDSIYRIEQHAFSTMKGLNLLDLSLNSLDIYGGQSMDFLHGLFDLKELRLNGNFEDGQGSYPNLEGVSALETLHLDGLFDTEIKYPYLKYLIYLRLSGTYGHCNLGKITNDTFRLVPHLKKLDVSNCNINNVHAGAFAMLYQLAWLDISYNMELGFSPLRNISYSLQFTKIDFLNLTKLHTYFERCSHITRRDVCFLRNTTLRELVIDSNKIEQVDTNMAQLMPDTFQVLRVRDNTFTFGLYLLQFGCLSNLTKLDIAYQNKPHSPLNYLSEPFQKPFPATYQKHSCIFDNPEYLRNISLSQPGCPYFESEKITIWDLYQASVPKTLKYISFHDSNMNYKIESYPAQPFFNNIEYIDISGNVLYEWSGPVGPFPRLKTINASRNYCSKITSGIFRYMPRLQNLHIQNNFLGIPLANNTDGSIFRFLNSLEQLDLSSNQISFLPPLIFKHLQNLRFLNLSHNNLNEWTVDPVSTPHLQFIDIQSNALSELPHSLMSQFDELKINHHYHFTISMKNNPLKCSCKHEKFLVWMVKNKDNFLEFDQYNFTGDSGNRLSTGECEKAIDQFDKKCRSFTILIALCSMSITLFISLIIVGLIYKNRWKLRYFLFMNKRRFFGIHSTPDYEPIENFKYDAFISYAEENIRFILDSTIPNLEHGDLSLCIHQRDFIVGNAVTDNINDAIQSSRKTVIILSKAFLKSKWCLYEFHMARMESIYSRDGKGCLIIVMLENMPPNKLVPLEMIEWIKQESYIEYTAIEEGNQLFWEKLKQAILH